MSFRALEIPGRFAAPPSLAITFEGRSYSARAGEPLAVTLLAHGIYVLSRSPKYHRARGLFCARGSCGNCLARVDGRANERLCLSRVRGPHVVGAQNVMGSARHDLLATIDWLFAGGLDHHHMMTRSLALNRLAVRMARKLAGLGELPTSPVEAGPVEQRQVEVLVVGAGPAGTAAAQVLSAAGVSTLLVDALPMAAAELADTAVLGLYDDHELLLAAPGRLIRVAARTLVIATGTHEQPPPVEGNDLPGVFSRRAAERVMSYGVLPGRRVVVAHDSGLAEPADVLAGQLRQAGASVLRTSIDQVRLGGSSRVESAHLADGNDTACDAFVWCGAPAPAYELPRQLGLELRFDPAQGFVPLADADGRTQREGVFLAGEVTGIAASEAAEHGARVGRTILQTARPS